MEIPVWKVKAFEELTTTELYQILLLRAEVFVNGTKLPIPGCRQYRSKSFAFVGRNGM